MIPQLPYNTENDLLKKLESFGIGTTPLLRRALTQVKQSHEYQRRDDGSPYLEQHVYPVAVDIVNVHKEKTSDILIAGALLHDVLEDDERVSDQSFIDIFGQELYNIVSPLTKRGTDNTSTLSEDKKRSVNQAMLQKLSTSHEFSKLIKLADRANNLASAAPLKQINAGKYHRYLLETKEDFLPFAKEISHYYFLKIKDTVTELEGLS